MVKSCFGGSRNWLVGSTSGSSALSSGGVPLSSVELGFSKKPSGIFNENMENPRKKIPFWGIEKLVGRCPRYMKTRKLGAP